MNGRKPGFTISLAIILVALAALFAIYVLFFGPGVSANRDAEDAPPSRDGLPSSP